MNTIHGVTAAELNNYNPEAFDAQLNADGTFDLIPVRWMNQEEYNEVQYGCGQWDDEECSDSELEEEAKRDAMEYDREEFGPGVR